MGTPVTYHHAIRGRATHATHQRLVAEHTAGQDPAVVAAHAQAMSHKYTVNFPEHGKGREKDPHYRAFEAFHRKYGPHAVCYIAWCLGTTEHCAKGPMELHHALAEWATQNAVDPAALHRLFPHMRADATQDEIDTFVESDENFRWLCAFHHRGHGGAHVASHSDWAASQVVPGLIT
jgi:hypothetical protein